MGQLKNKYSNLKDFLNLNISCPPIDEQNLNAKKYENLLMMYKVTQSQLNEIQDKLTSFYENNIEEEEK